MKKLITVLALALAGVALLAVSATPAAS